MTREEKLKIIKYWVDELIRDPFGKMLSWKTVNSNLRMMGIQTPGDSRCSTCPVAEFLSKMCGFTVLVSAQQIGTSDRDWSIWSPYNIRQFVAINDSTPIAIINENSKKKI